MTWSALEEIESCVDPSVRDDVLAFHVRSNWLLGVEGALPRPCNTTLVNVSDSALKATAGQDFPLGVSFPKEVPLSGPGRPFPMRGPSAKAFCPQAVVNSEIVGGLLGASFSPLAHARRPYPSAGALYPAGIAFVGFEGRMGDAQFVGTFHYRPAKHVLELMDHKGEQAIRRALFGDTTLPARHACCALVYFFHVGVAVFKYRHRGYRHVMLEIGAMGQQVDLVAKELGLASRIWSGFSDFELSRAMGLNPYVAPIVITQLLGIESKEGE